MTLPAGITGLGYGLGADGTTLPVADVKKKVTPRESWYKMASYLTSKYPNLGAQSIQDLLLVPLQSINAAATARKAATDQTLASLSASTGSYLQANPTATPEQITAYQTAVGTGMPGFDKPKVQSALGDISTNLHTAFAPTSTFNPQDQGKLFTDIQDTIASIPKGNVAVTGQAIIAIRKEANDMGVQAAIAAKLDPASTQGQAIVQQYVDYAHQRVADNLGVPVQQVEQYGRPGHALAPTVPEPPPSGFLDTLVHPSNWFFQG